MSDTNGSGLFGSIQARRRSSGPARADGRVAIDDVDAYPMLTSLLTELPKGAAKGAKSGRVALFVQDGRLTACLTVPSMVAVAFVALEDFSRAFPTIENALREGSIDWREDRSLGRK